jgi:hypothetical protein
MIAYLDTHIGLGKGNTVPKREWECARYTADEMVDVLKESFEDLREKVSHTLKLVTQTSG